MTLLESVQQAAVDADAATVDRQCRLLAARLESRPLEDWLAWESEGYPASAEVPSYRVWPIEVRATFSGPFQSMAKNYLVPPVLLPKNVRDQYEHWVCRMSVASLQASLTESVGGQLYVSTGNLSLLLGENVLSGYNCIEARGSFRLFCQPRRGPECSQKPGP